MKSFYEHLKEGKTKDAALHQAKLDYLSDSSNPEPYFWATFVPIGDMSPIDLATLSLSWDLALVSIFLTLVLGFILYKSKTLWTKLK